MLDLMRMANLEPVETGLDYLIWLGNTADLPRIIVVRELNTIDPSRGFCVSIGDNPYIFGGDNLIPKEHLNKIFQWIIINKDVLLQHSRNVITDRRMRSLLKSV